MPPHPPPPPDGVGTGTITGVYVLIRVQVFSPPAASVTLPLALQSPVKLWA